MGTYTLQGGYLYAGEIVVGGSVAAKGGTGTLTISGGNAIVDGTLRIWSGSTVNLGLGGLLNSDVGHPVLDVFNDGRISLGDSNGAPVVYCFGDVTGDGSIVIGTGATLWVNSLEQDSVWINAGGTLVLAAEDPQLYAEIAMRNYELAVPEPGTLAVMSFGGLWLARSPQGAREKGSGLSVAPWSALRSDTRYPQFDDRSDFPGGVLLGAPGCVPLSWSCGFRAVRIANRRRGLDDPSSHGNLVTFSRAMSRGNLPLSDEFGS